MVSNVISTARKCGSYGVNFLFGTGSNTVGQEIKDVYNARKALNLSRTQAIRQGFKDGFVKSHIEMQAAGGFFKNLRKVFSEMPKNMKNGWSGAVAENKRFFGKLYSAIKPLGKASPFIFNALWLVSCLPDIVGRTKQDGIWGGIKETGKALVNMSAISLAAVAAAPFGFIPAIAAPLVAGAATSAIFGKSFSMKKAEAEEAEKLAKEQQNPFVNKPQVGQKLDITSAA